MPLVSGFVLPSQRLEPYEDVEKRIQGAVAFIQASQNEDSPGKLNVEEIGRTYEVPVRQLRRRLQGRQSMQEG